MGFYEIGEQVSISGSSGFKHVVTTRTHEQVLDGVNQQVRDME